MALIALQTFLVFLGDEFCLNVRDYERIAFALQAGGTWTIEQFRDMLLSLLVKDFEQQEVFLRQFNMFFKPVSEPVLSDNDVSLFLDKLKELTHNKIKKTKPKRSFVRPTVRHLIPGYEKENRKINYGQWGFMPLLCMFFLLILDPFLFPMPVPPNIPDVSIHEPKPHEIITETLTKKVCFIKKIETIPVKLHYKPSKKFKIYAAAAVLLLFMFIAYGFYLWYSSKIRDDLPPPCDYQDPDFFSLGVIGGKPEPVFNDDTLDNISDSLGYFQSQYAGKDLDIDKSIQLSLDNGGIPVLEFYKQKQVYTLLILEDRFAESLEWNPIVTELVYGMQQRGVSIVYGCFTDSPEIFKTPDGSVHKLEDFENKKHGFLMLIFTDSKWLFKNQNKFVLEALARLPKIAWMELSEPKFWHKSRLDQVQKYDIPVFFASPEGVVQAVHKFLTEQGSVNKSFAGMDFCQEIPVYKSDKPDAYMEVMLGDALIWAQDCAMIQPVSLGLAHALRLQFHDHLPFHRIQRFFALPDTIWNASGIYFNDDVLKALRTGFMTRRTEKEQEEVLRFILNKIQEHEPENKECPAHLAWEFQVERVYMELGADDNFKRLSQLANSELRNFIMAELEKFCFKDENQGIPLRIQKPKNKHALQRLARINENFKIKKLEKYPVSKFQKMGLVCIAVLCFVFFVLSLKSYFTPIPVQNFEIAGLGKKNAKLEIMSFGKWKTDRTGNIFDLTKTLLNADKQYRFVLPGTGDKYKQEFTASNKLLTRIIIETHYEKSDMEFIKIPKGCYQMGSPKSEKGRFSNEGPVHEVCLDEFWMAKNEVTNKQYREFKADHDSGNYNDLSFNDENQPVVNVSWEDAKAFIKWINQKYEGKYEFSLPTEAQWEYACRAGTKTARFWGDNPDDACKYANVHDLKSKQVNKDFVWQNHKCNDGYAVTAPVGSFKPNQFGLNDMLGNVWEWCEDSYKKDAYKEYQSDNSVTQSGVLSRVVRGGSWLFHPAGVRCAYRRDDLPAFRYNGLGFRLLRK